MPTSSRAKIPEQKTKVSKPRMGHRRRILRLELTFGEVTNSIELETVPGILGLWGFPRVEFLREHRPAE